MSLPELQDSVESLMMEKHIPGLFLVMVNRDSVIWQGGIGTANNEQQKVNDSTLFKMGSVTKSFAALAILKLAEQGRISLNDNLSDIAPEFPIENDWETTHPVKVVHLLEHTAGFDDIHLHADYNSQKTQLSTSALVNAHKNSLYCRWRAGTRHSYTNVGYVVLSYLVEKMSGKLYDDFIQENIFQPLDMSHSNFDVFSIGGNESKGYMYDKKHGIQEIKSRQSNALAGDLKSSARDMSRLLHFFLNNGKKDSIQILSLDNLDRMEKTHTTFGAQAGLDHYYGLGNTLGHPYAKLKLRGHGGGVPGFTAYYGYNRNAGIGYAIAINLEGGLYPIRQLVFDFLTQDLEGEYGKEPTLPATLNKEYLAPFLGYYQFNSPKAEMGAFIDRLGGIRLFMKEGYLNIQQINGSSSELIPVSDSTFRYENVDLTTVALVRDHAGNPVVATFDAYYEKTSYLSLLSMNILLIGSIIVGLSVFPFGLIWTVFWLRKRISGKEALIRLVPVFTVGLTLVIIAMAMYLLVFDRENIGSKSIYEVIIFLGTLAFPLLALSSLSLALYRFIIKKKDILGYYLVLVGFSLSSLAILLIANDLIGLRLWAY